jgi:hypothetical protein
VAVACQPVPMLTRARSVTASIIACILEHVQWRMVGASWQCRPRLESP